MIDEEIIRNLKRQYGHIFSVDIENKDYVFRLLTDEEFNAINSFIGDPLVAVEAEDAIFQTCVVYPTTDYAKIPAGHITTVAEKILEVSGYSDGLWIGKLLDEERSNEAKSTRRFLKAFIMAAMPSYSEEDLNQLNIYQLIEKVVLAENIFDISQSSFNTEIPMRVALGAVEESGQDNKTKLTEDQRRTLIKQIREQEKESGAPTSTEDLNKMDDELLLRMKGSPKLDDPIARKLRQAMGV